MGKLPVRVLAGVLLAVVWPTARAQPEFVFGVYPYLTATEIIEQYAPVRDYLAKILHRQVSMVSAKDFPTFMDRTRRGDYDVVFTAPHLGRLAELRDGWRGVVQSGFQMEIVVLARKDSPIRQLRDLRHRSIAIGSRNSMTYQIVNEALQRQGLALEKDVAVVESASFSNVVHTVARGEADSGATGLNLWGAAPASEHAALRLVFKAQPSPGFLIMANPRLDDATIESLRRGLVDFGTTPEGKAYFRRTRQIDFRPIDDATMRRIDPFTSVLMEQQ